VAAANDLAGTEPVQEVHEVGAVRAGRASCITPTDALIEQRSTRRSPSPYRPRSISASAHHGRDDGESFSWVFLPHHDTRSFRDGVDVLAAAGAVSVVQPGGSVRDEEVIAAADDHKLAMLFTGMRHFRH
jgi:hypothetical protein